MRIVGTWPPYMNSLLLSGEDRKWKRPQEREDVHVNILSCEAGHRVFCTDEGPLSLSLALECPVWMSDVVDMPRENVNSQWIE